MALVKSSQEVTNSLIGVNSFFAGQFFINGSLKIDGKFEGKLLRAHQIYIGSTGKVKTDIQAESAIIEGTVIGNIITTIRVMLLPSARVFGDIKTPELIIQKGVILEGRCQIASNLSQSAKGFIMNEYSKDNLDELTLFGSDARNS